MIRYEILFLAVPEITLEDAAVIESHLQKAVTEHKGSFLSYERWGKYRLAYPVSKREYGVYFLVRFELPEQDLENNLQAVRNVLVLKYNELVMRHVVSRLDAQASLVYQRPESLEDAAKRSEAQREGKSDDLRADHARDAGRMEMQGEA